MDMVRETLQARRPSRDEQFAETVSLFTPALDSFVAKVKQDRYVIAAILFGSLSHDTVWRKSDIDVILIGREEKPVQHFNLVENGVNIHAILYPRSKFKQALEGSLHGAFLHSSFALSRLLFTTDDTIRAYYDDVRRVGSRDRQMRLLAAGSCALHSLAKAEKWLLTRRDVAYSGLWIMFTVQHLATIEVLLQGELTTREVIPQALALNPAFFDRVYRDLVEQPNDETTIQRALALINQYLDEKVDLLFGPVLDYLRSEGGVRTTSELNTYFMHQAQTETLGMVYEWLADKGIIQKVPSPVRLTPKSQVVLDEAAYYYDGLGAEDGADTERRPHPRFARPLPEGEAGSLPLPLGEGRGEGVAATGRAEVGLR
jgi:predicted nucleotidyltransferase